MKISVGDEYSHYYDVYLNGERLNNCVFADEEEGIAKVLKTNANIFEKFNEETLHGKVELKWIGPGNDPNRNFQVL